MKLKINKQKFKFIYLEITNHCNLSCPFCPSSLIKRNDFLDIITLENRIKELSKYTDTVYLHILGEPLLHPNFIDILKILNTYNIKIRITTNGTLLHKYDFSNVSINKISISLQSLIQFDDKRIKNYFNNLKVFLEHVKDMLSSKTLGIDFRIWNDKENSNIELFNKKLESYLIDYLEINKLDNCRISYDNEFTWPDEDDEANKKSMKCLGGKTHLGVLVNGDVVLCCLDYSGKTKIGNLNENRLEEILSSDLYQNAMIKMQAGIPYFKLCESCLYRNKFN